jgi:hypothetical protein
MIKDWSVAVAVGFEPTPARKPSCPFEANASAAYPIMKTKFKSESKRLRPSIMVGRLDVPCGAVTKRRPDDGGGDRPR